MRLSPVDAFDRLSSMRRRVVSRQRTEWALACALASLLMLAALAVADVVATPASAASCGAYTVPGTGARFERITTKGISCAAAKRALRKYAYTGEGLHCRRAGGNRWRCSRGPALIRYVQPACGEGSCSGEYRLAEADAIAARACGSFRVPGLFTAVRVQVKRGSVSCARAMQIMRALFAHARGNVRGWSCVGPQTGYAACTKGNSKITASF